MSDTTITACPGCTADTYTRNNCPVAATGLDNAGQEWNGLCAYLSDHRPGCAHCGAQHVTTYHGQGGEGALCRECAEREIPAWAGDLDEDEQDDLHRRVEKAIATNPEAYRVARNALVIAGMVDYDEFL